MASKKGGGPPAMLLVIGVSGSGKSNLINLLAGQDFTEVGDSLYSCTSSCKLLPAMVGNTRTMLVDTPGFDDTERSNGEILEDISNTLALQYQLQIKLQGVLYLHRITDNRLSGGAMKTLNMFNKICGEDALKNVILVTTHWDIVDPVDGARRESELRDKTWKLMLSKGATMARSYGDAGSAKGFASQLLGKESVVLDLQRQVVDEGKSLKETSAGSELGDELQKLKLEYQQQIREFEEQKEKLLAGDRAMREEMQKELEQEKRKYKKLVEQQQRLNNKPAQVVSQKIRAGKRQRLGKGLNKVMPLIDLVGAFVGIPVGAAGILTAWLGLAPEDAGAASTDPGVNDPADTADPADGVDPDPYAPEEVDTCEY